MIRQKMFLMADGMVTRGLGVSQAAKDTSSEPEYENAAVTKTFIVSHAAAGLLTEQTPLKPFANAPGSCQYFAPMYSEYDPLLGPPPQMQMTAMMRNIETTMSLSHDVQNSVSA